MNKLYKTLEHFFYKTLCCRPDRNPYWLSCWWYNFTGKISSYFHRKTCESCKEKYQMRKLQEAK